MIEAGCGSLVQSLRSSAGIEVVLVLERVRGLGFWDVTRYAVRTIRGLATPLPTVPSGSRLVA